MRVKEGKDLGCFWSKGLGEKSRLVIGKKG